MGYTASQRAKYMPPPCPRCGGTISSTTWMPSTDQQSNEPEWEPTAWRCLDCTSSHVGGLPDASSGS